jgi:hypothetical protein
MFLATGSDDKTVSANNTCALAGKLRASGTRTVVKTYQEIDHPGTLLALSRLRRETAPVLNDLVQFLDGNLR